jgi:phosphoenolpyruvate carboxykinase (GTP)
MTSNKTVLDWVDECVALCRPDKVVWIDGSEAQLDELRQEALATGELIALNPEKHPGCYLHRSHPEDVARVEHRTFICTRHQADAGPNNNWIEKDEAYATLRTLYDGCMVGRTMYVVPFLMGPYGSPYSKAGVEITDSIYVTVSMAIMARVGSRVFEELGDSNDWVRCLHAKADLDPEKRYICHFPEDNAVWSINSGYGGNALMGKKCFALRIASYQALNEGWMAEHMLIVGVERPDGKVTYITGAFPSACGKTNLAMLIPPEVYEKRGYKITCIGDDIAWMHQGEDGRLYAINGEKGFFGVAPGTNAKTNPNALASVSKNTIFTNVALCTDDNTVWWEGLTETPPANLLDWQGNPWSPDMGRPAAHPNSRFTAPIENCPILSPLADAPEGVPVSAMLFGGRRAKTAPLVYEAKNWRHGVYVGSTMASETTAAAAGKVGVVRRDPMAMLPFCGYNMGDYFAHYLRMGEKLGDKAPKIYNVNWFRTDENGKFIWPGFGENLRVLDWIIDRVEGKGEAVELPVGYVPAALDTEALNLSEEKLQDLLSIDPEHWLEEELPNIRQFYAQFGDRLPAALLEELDALEARLKEAAGK